MLGVFILSLIILAPLQGQRGAAAPTASVGVSALDYYEIQQLNARFVHKLDTAEDGGNAFANLFTADGVFIAANGKRYDGHDQLSAFVKEDPDSRKGPTNVVHYVVNLAVDATPGGARDHGYMLVATDTSPSPGVRAITDGGQYWDDLVRTPVGWRIKMRTLVRPNSSTPVAVARATQTVTPSSVSSMPHPFTAQDYADIDQLFALYGYAYDSAADQGYAWANLMTPDAIFANERSQLKGSDTIAGFTYGTLTIAGGFISLKRGPITAKNPLAIAHCVTDVMIEPVAEGAVATAYRLNGNITADGRPTLTPGGMYYILLVPTSEGWRFKETWYILANGTIADGARRFMPKHGDPPVAATQRPPTMPALALAAEDDAEIRQLYARYSHAMDSAADDGRALAQLFTPDGVFLDTWTNKVYVGQEQLAALARGAAADSKGPTNMNQFIWTVKIEAAPQGALAKAYVMTGKLQAPGQPIVMTNGGQYWDDLVKTATGWRIRKRTFFRTSQTPPLGSQSQRCTGGTNETAC